MITEWLYRVRGIDKWPTTTATVTSTNIFSGYRGSSNTILFTYTPAGAPSRSGRLVAEDSASLFGINPSDTFDLQYDLKNPKRIYCTESEAANKDLGILIVVGVAVFIVYQVAAACVRNFGH